MTNSTKNQSDDENDDALFAALEEENDHDAEYRANRIKELQSDLSNTNSNNLRTTNNSSSPSTLSRFETPLQPSSSAIEAGAPTTSNEREGVISTLLNNSTYPTLPNDQSLLDFTTQVPRCVIHFFHPDFSRCQLMDKHISVLAENNHRSGHSETTRFARVDARNAPFIVTKMKIKVLPCVVGFAEGVVVEKVVGFDGLGIGNEEGFDTRMLEKRFIRCGILKGSGGREDDDDDRSDGDDEEEAERWGFRKMKTIRSGGIKKGRQNDDDDDDDWD